MREETQWKLLRIFVTDKDTVHGRPLFHEILLRARETGLAGATVLRAVAGYGRAGHIHSSGLIDAAEEIPLVVEICDAREKIQAALPMLEKLIEEAACGGLLTIESTSVIIFGGAK